jgi:uncharacterized protein YndB with AHSA1/START domain
MLDLTLQNEIEITASAANVWDVLTNPEHIKKYLFGTKTESDWKKGSSLVFSGAYQGKAYEDHGTILEAKKGKTLKYDYWSSFSGVPDVPENYSTITFDIKPQKKGVMLSLSQQGFVSQQSYEHSQKNWQMVLEEIKKIAESL